MRADLDRPPILARVRIKEGRSYHAYGQVFRKDRPVEVFDPEVLARIRTDGMLTMTLTEAGRRAAEAKVEARADVAKPAIVESGCGGPAAHALADMTAQAVQEATAHAAQADGRSEDPATAHATAYATAHADHGGDVPTDDACTAQAGDDATGPAEHRATQAEEDDPDVEMVDAGVPEKILAVLDACRTPRTRTELQKLTGLQHRMHFQRTYLNPLLATGLLARTIPDNPRASNQRYVTTAAGLAVVQG